MLVGFLFCKATDNQSMSVGGNTFFPNNITPPNNFPNSVYQRPVAPSLLNEKDNKRWNDNKRETNNRRQRPTVGLVV
ncbi:hypothetical protein Hanom_Chr09g00852491 [Helianthus anomalus]